MEDIAPKWDTSATDFVPKSPRFVDETGNTYNKLTAMYPVGRSTAHSSSYIVWCWRCECGGTTEKTAYDVRRGHTVSCGCSNRHKKSTNWKGHHEIPGKMLWVIKRSAAKRGHEYSLTNEYIWELFLNQGRLCALSGVPIGFLNKNSGVVETTASLDRIDSTKGYVEGNVQWVHKHINKMKNKFPQDYFIELCRKVAENQ